MGAHGHAPPGAWQWETALPPTLPLPFSIAKRADLYVVAQASNISNSYLHHHEFPKKEGDDALARTCNTIEYYTTLSSNKKVGLWRCERVDMISLFPALAKPIAPLFVTRLRCVDDGSQQSSHPLHVYHGQAPY